MGLEYARQFIASRRRQFECRVRAAAVRRAFHRTRSIRARTPVCRVRGPRNMSRAIARASSPVHVAQRRPWIVKRRPRTLSPSRHFVPAHAFYAPLRARESRVTTPDCCLFRLCRAFARGARSSALMRARVCRFGAAFDSLLAAQTAKPRQTSEQLHITTPRPTSEGKYSKIYQTSLRCESSPKTKTTAAANKRTSTRGESKRLAAGLSQSPQTPVT